MAITARIANGYAWRMVIIGAVSGVLGAWGVYDYVIKIPRNQQLSDRRELLEMCQAALQTEQLRDQPSPEAAKAVAAVDSEVQLIISRALEETQGTAPTPDDVSKNLVIEASGDGAWLKLLLDLKAGLNAPRQMPLSEDTYPDAYTAYQATQAAIDEIGAVVTPGKYDRITQWAFILCLPCAPYFFWLVVVARRQRYQLDDDGTLLMPEGTWKAADITDIDMSRWMAKSIAHVVDRDGVRVKLDDYKYRNLHLIIGAVASRVHPDDWDAEAKPIKAEAASEASETASS